MKFVQNTKEEKAQIRAAALLLRFRTENPGLKTRKHISYAKIA